MANMPSLETVGIGKNCTLVYQKSKTDPYKIRAITKDAMGNVITRGPVVPLAEHLRSAREAIGEWMKIYLPLPEPVIDPLSAALQGLFDEPKEDAEEEEDEEELL